MAGALLIAPACAAGAESWDRCVADLRGRALSAGIDANTFDRHVAGLQPDPSVLPLLDAQPEFTTPIWDYLSGLVDDERVADGRAMLAQHRVLLDGVATQYGIDAETVVAVWGVESDFGRVTGSARCWSRWPRCPARAGANRSFAVS